MADSNSGPLLSRRPKCCRVRSGRTLLERFGLMNISIISVQKPSTTWRWPTCTPVCNRAAHCKPSNLCACLCRRRDSRRRAARHNTTTISRLHQHNRPFTLCTEMQRDI
jgi:hypothetical protein